MLKEMLKIDGAGTGSPSSQEAANTSGGQQQNRRRSSKKLGTELITTPHIPPRAIVGVSEEHLSVYNFSLVFLSLQQLI